MKDVSIKNVKGTFDYLPSEQLLRNYVTDTLKEVFSCFGYQPVETPILCYYDVLASKYGGGAEILKEVYRLSDQGKRDLALRYDLTVPFAKLITLIKDLPMPFKRFEIGKVFRDGPVKVGRNREFTQCDVDVVGISSLMSDAELISLYVTAFQKLHLSCTVFYNNRKLMSGLLQLCGVEEERMNDVIIIIDKFKKMTKEELKKEFLEAHLTEAAIEKLYQLFSMSFTEIIKLSESSSNELLQAGVQELKEVQSYLEEMGIASYTSMDFTLARGLNIYTGTVFEVFANGSHMTSAIGGGGRYDQIITNLIQDGNSYPAVGCSFGLDAICEVLKENLEEIKQSSLDLFIVPLGASKEVLRLAHLLRQENIRLDIQMCPRKLNKILNWVDREKIPFVLVMGSEEVSKREITMKSMLSSSTQTFSLDDISGMVAYIKENRPQGSLS